MLVFKALSMYYSKAPFFGDVGSKSALGEAMSIDEKKNLRQELKSLKVEDYSSFMESVPSEFLTLLRTE